MHKPELIRAHGDYLERDTADKILARIPGYALFWATYIGNDGNASNLPMPGVDKEVLATRVHLWEHLYTLFESLALCWRLEDSFAELKALTTPAQYADNLNAWIAFYAHLGRIHDMAEKAAAQFQGEGLFVPFDSFNENRHTVLHYPKVPMCWAESVLASPRLGETPRDWKQGMRWSELNHQGFEFLCDIVASTLRDLEKVINAFMYRIAELVTSQLQFVPVEWPEASQTFHKSELSSPPSGAYFEVAVEANDSVPLSGTLNVRVRERQ